MGMYSTFNNSVLLNVKFYIMSQRSLIHWDLLCQSHFMEMCLYKNCGLSNSCGISLILWKLKLHNTSVYLIKIPYFIGTLSDTVVY